MDYDLASVPDEAIRYYTWGVEQCNRIGVPLSSLSVFWAPDRVAEKQDIEAESVLIYMAYDTNIVRQIPAYQGIVFDGERWIQGRYPASHATGCALRFLSPADAANYEVTGEPYFEYLVFPTTPNPSRPLTISQGYFVSLGCPPASFIGRTLYSLDNPPGEGAEIYVPQDKELFILPEESYIIQGGLATVVRTQNTENGLTIWVERYRNPISWREIAGQQYDLAREHGTKLFQSLYYSWEDAKRRGHR